jgi:DNA-binding beta-propeller fold protein YncE
MNTGKKPSIKILLSILLPSVGLSTFLVVLFVFILKKKKSIELYSSSSITSSSSTSVIPELQKVYLYTQHDTVTSSAVYQIIAFEVNKSTGKLTEIQRIDSGRGPNHIMKSKDSRFLFVPNLIAPSISVYSIDLTTGLLTSVEKYVNGDILAPTWIVAHPTLSVIYVSDYVANKIHIMDYNQTTGALTKRGDVPAASSVSKMCINKLGTIIYTAETSNKIGIYNISTANGSITSTNSITMSNCDPSHVTLSPDNKILYVSGFSTRSVHSFLISGNQLTDTGFTEAGSDAIRSIKISPNNDHIYISDYTHLSSRSTNTTTGTFGGQNILATNQSSDIAFWRNYAFLLGYGNKTIETRTTDGSVIGSVAIQETDTYYNYSMTLEIVEYYV